MSPDGLWYTVYAGEDWDQFIDNGPLNGLFGNLTRLCLKNTMKKIQFNELHIKVAFCTVNNFFGGAYMVKIVYVHSNICYVVRWVSSFMY